MSYEVKLLQGEKVIETITQDIAGKGFLFWRRFTITLTDKRLHAYQKLMISHSQKTFDLQDIDSVNQEKRLNTFFALFVSSVITYLFYIIVGGIWNGLTQSYSFSNLFSFITFIFWIAVFVYYLYKRVIIVHSRNDQMSIDAIRMAEGRVTDFVQAVLRQKETVLGSASSQHSSPSSTNAVDKLKQLSELRSQGIITDSEFEAKKKEILKNL